MYFYGKKLLFLGAHPDDIELGCGSILHQVKGRSDVRCFTLSNNQKNPALKNILSEHAKAMAVLGVTNKHDIIGNFKTRSFQQARQEILDSLHNISKEFNPDIVFVHTACDVHQDHNVLTAETLRAFRKSTIFGYEIVRSSYKFVPQFFVEVTEKDIAQKIKALAQYKTYKDKYYFNPALIRAVAIYYGALAENAYAEGFEILRAIGKFKP